MAKQEANIEIADFGLTVNSDGLELVKFPHQASFDSTSIARDDDVDDEDDDKSQQVPLRQLFRFADVWDRALILLGSIAAILHGTVYVASNLVLGFQIDGFLDYQKASDYIGSMADVWEKYGLTENDIWDNKTLIDIVGALEDNAGLNSSFVSLDIDQDIFLQNMTQFTYWYLAVAGITLICAFFQVTCWSLAGARQVRRIRAQYFKSLLQQDMAWFDCLTTEEISSNVSDDMQKILHGMDDRFGALLQMASSFCVAFLQGFAISWQITLAMILIVPVLIGAGYMTNKINARETRKEIAAYSRAGSIAEEVLSSMPTVAAFSGEKKEFDRYSRHLGDACTQGIRRGRNLGLGTGLFWFMLYIVYALGFWRGAYIVRYHERYTAGQMLIVFFSVVVGSTAIGQASQKLQSISSARCAAYSIFKVIDRVPGIRNRAGAKVPDDSSQGDLEFRHVSFHYPSRPQTAVLKDISFKVTKGQTTAFVGASGCGKTTITKLILRLYDATAGAIYLDNHRLDEIDIKWLRRQITIVRQEPVLFSASVADNIRYGQDGVTEAEVEEAAKQANAHDFIIQLPEKYRTVIGGRGAQLSGGQKQRIAIARALVRNPRILLLDEATSALDAESEASVQDALEKAREGRTTIVVAHRLSSIRSADLIICVEDGMIAEMGSHERLIAKDGLYRRLVASQMSTSLGTIPDRHRSGSEATAAALQQTATGTPRRRSSILESLKQGVKSVTGGPSSFTIRSSILREEHSPQPAAQRDIIEPAPLSRIAQANKEEWPYVLGGCVSSIICGAQTPAFAVLLSYIVSVFLYEDENKLMDRYCSGLLLLGVTAGVSQFFMNYFFAQSGERLTMRLRKLTFKAMLRQEMGYFEQPGHDPGALATQLSADTSAVQGATGVRLGLLLQNVANIGVGIVIAFTYSWQITLVMVAFLPIIALAGLMETRVLTGAAKSDQDPLEKAEKISSESTSNITTVAALNLQDTFAKQYSREIDCTVRSSRQSALALGTSFALSQGLYYCGFAAAFYCGTTLIRDGVLDFTEVFTVVSVLVFGAMGMGEALAFAPDYAHACVAAAKLFHVMDRKSAIDSSSSRGKKPEKSSGEIQFKSVNFYYPQRPEVSVLSSLDFSVKAGQEVALVGTSGCGKTTTLSLLERFYDATCGDILYDGEPVENLDLKWLRSRIGLVQQEPTLFDVTLYENIAYGDNSRDVPMVEVIAAAKHANIHEFISTLPEGYDTRAGSGGKKLSGGQKQRVAIARALIRDPKLLLLDEATSALDAESEETVHAALDRARCGRTSLVVTHRLASIRKADLILVLDQGRIQEQGTHAELMERQGLYHNLVQLQNREKITGEKS